LYRENMPSDVLEVLTPDDPPAVRLMNTVWADRHGRHDALADASALRHFLRIIGADGVGARATVTVDQVAEARRLRDALRRLGAAVTEDDRPAAATGLSERAATDTVNRFLVVAPAETLRRSRDGWVLRAAVDSPVNAALTALAREGAGLVADPSRPLDACRAPGCVLYFVRDHPRREWCGVTCGNRVRAARHYARTRAARR
jgi:predicted RNA-binding Zn ribbon-like protein